MQRHKRIMEILAMLTMAALVMGGCEKKNDEPDSDGVYAVPRDSDRHVAASPPADDAQGPDESRAGDGIDIHFAGLTATFSDTWIEEQPANPMRAAQMRVPGAGDAGDASLVIFPGIFGTLEDNIARLASQFTTDSGEPVTPEIEERTVGDLSVTIITLRGTYDGGMNPETAGPNQAMIQAIIQAPGGGGNSYIRLLGPAETVDANRAAFLEMINSLR